MSRLIRKTVIAAKIHAAYNVDPVPTGAANAMLVSNVSIEPLNLDSKDRDVIRAYLGASESVPGVAYKSVGMDVELAGSGTVGEAPAWGPLVRACGFAETVTADTRVDYTPVSDSPDAVAIYYWDDGVLYKLLGARGSAQIKLTQGEIPKLSFKFVGIDGGEAAQANPAADTTAFQQPQVVKTANTDKVTWDCTHDAGIAPALVAGTPYVSQGLEIDLGVTASFTSLLGGESVPITNRAVTGFCAMELTKEDTVAFMGKVRATTLESLGIKHGTVEGSKTLVYLPSVQCVSTDKREINGVRLEGFNLKALPVAGNDEIRIVTSF